MFGQNQSVFVPVREVIWKTGPAATSISDDVVVFEARQLLHRI